MFNSIKHFAFFVRDCNLSKRFYQEHFDFKLLEEKDFSATGLGKVIFLSLGGMVLELIEIDNPPPISGCHICLGTEDFDEDFKRLTAAGIKVAGKPVPARAGKRASFWGPDSEEIEING